MPIPACSVRKEVSKGVDYTALTNPFFLFHHAVTFLYQVAPTDDSFTVIAPGSEDKDSDGPTLIGNPDLGFSR